MKVTENAMKKTFIAMIGTAALILSGGCKNDTPSVPIGGETPASAEFTSIEALKTYLAGHSGGTSAAAPIRAKLSGVVLSEDDTAGLFAALYAANKYVSFDLSGCTGLTVWGHMSGGAAKTVSLALPDTVTEIANGSLAGFTSLKTLTASGVHTVGVSAFVNCTALASISLPKATNIGEDAFLNCTALTSLTLGTTTISTTVFYNAGKDTAAGFTIYVPTVQAKPALDAAIADSDSNWYKALYTDIGAGWFKEVAVAAQNAPELTGTVSITGSAQVGQTLTAVVSLGGNGSVSYQWMRGEADISGATQATYTLTEADEGTAIKVRASRAGYAGSISSAPTATVAADFAEFTSIAALKTYLAGHSGGTSADEPIPLKLSGVALSTTDTMRSLLTAGKYVSLDLSGCAGLTEWAWYPYSGIEKIVSLALPDSVTVIANEAFYNFTSLKTLAASGVQTVGTYAFSQCSALASASLPAATSIGNYAFYNCTALVSENLPAAATIGASAFSGCTALVSASLPAVTSIGGQAFYQCYALASVSLPGATSIGERAFHDCTALASLTLGTTLPTISFLYTFYNAGENTTAGFTIYVPTAQAKTALDAAIADTGSNWHKALKTTYIGNGRFKGVAIAPQ
jgi:hypothetical protein